MQTLSVMLLVLMLLPVVFSLSFMPYLTRETISFGVTVNEETYRSEPLRRMRRAYATLSLSLYAVLFLACLLGVLRFGGAEAQFTIFAIGIGIMVVISIVLNIVFHLNMKKRLPSLPSTPAEKSKVVIDTGFRRNKLTWSNAWFLVHAAIIAGCVLLTLANYDAIPDQIAMKFDFAGNVTRFADKTMLTALFPNFMQVVMTLLFLFINWSINHSKQQTYAGDPERSVRQSTLFRRNWSLYTLISGLAMVLLFSFIQLNMLYPMDTDLIMLVSLAVPVFIVLFAAILSFITGQGGSRLGRKQGPSAVQPANDDRYWKLGGLYYNPQDPSIFVEKRMGIGWTLNFAHPVGWIILGGVLIVIAVAAIISG
ncbi:MULTISPECIES: DUF1648 domain-containing protein [Paenibacillus]|uniref:DUF1648 domain-containing protein n=1 Tax=Paenibacillus TaxID=44249 RepID=UPI002FE26E38